MKDTVVRFDATITKWIAATFGQRPHGFFLFATALGDPLAIGLITTLLIATGLYLGDTPLVLSAVMIPVTVLVGALLKLLFERARPLTEYALNMKLQTFSFPSGHSNGSMITYGLLAYLAFMLAPASLTVPLGILLALVPFVVGLSRVYLGAHFPSDVIAGWLLGGLSLILVITLIGPMS